MHASAIIALGAAALAAAAPTTQTKKDSFEVSKFVFGCTGMSYMNPNNLASTSLTLPFSTAGCYYYFDVAYNGGESYHCEGSTKATDYLQCTGADDNVLAYIDNTTDKTKNILKLQYEDSDVEAGTRYNYYGHKRVYAATSGDADKQKAKFAVKVSSATGVAK
jgi:hypothetical protein